MAKDAEQMERRRRRAAHAPIAWRIASTPRTLTTSCARCTQRRCRSSSPNEFAYNEWLNAPIDQIETIQVRVLPAGAFEIGPDNETEQHTGSSFYALEPRLACGDIAEWRAAGSNLFAGSQPPPVGGAARRQVRIK